MDQHTPAGLPRWFDFLKEDGFVRTIFDGLETIETSCEHALRASRKIEIAFEELLELYEIPARVESWTMRPL